MNKLIIRILFTGRSYHTNAQLPSELNIPDDSGVAEVLEQLDRLLPEGQELPRSCLVAVSGNHIGTVENHQSNLLRDGDELMLIAPVAGG